MTDQSRAGTTRPTVRSMTSGFFFLFYSDNTLEGREGGENLRMLDVDLVFILHCKLCTHISLQELDYVNFNRIQVHRTLQMQPVRNPADDGALVGKQSKKRRRAASSGRLWECSQQQESEDCGRT